MKQFSALNRDPKARYNHWRKKCEVGDCGNGRKQRKREEYTEKKGTFFLLYGSQVLVKWNKATRVEFVDPKKPHRTCLVGFLSVGERKL